MTDIEKSEEYLIGDLSGRLSALCLGSFTDDQITNVVGQWVALCVSSKRPGDWGATVLRNMVHLMGNDPDERCKQTSLRIQRIASTQKKIAHDGQNRVR